MHFRLKAWRSRNDEFRDLPDRRKPLPSEQPLWWRENLENLQRLIPPNMGENGALLAEIARELGSFAECVRQIDTLMAANHWPTGGGVVFVDPDESCDPGLLVRIRDLALQENPFVQRVS
jgi:hypothetical protein